MVEQKVEPKVISIAKTVTKLEIPEIFVAVKKEKIDRRTWVMYKTIPDWDRKIINELIVRGTPDKEFHQFVTDKVNAYIFQKEAPPAEIASAIINIADDHLSGREPVIRAGDYIAIQNYLRGMKEVQ